jgi:hypothetical protein
MRETGLREKTCSPPNPQVGMSYVVFAVGIRRHTDELHAVLRTCIDHARKVGGTSRTIIRRGWGSSARGDLNPHAGEISLDLGLNSKTGEKSPDRGVHAAMVAGVPGLASTRRRRLTVYQGAAGPAVSQAEPGTYLLGALWPGNGYPRVPNRAGKLAESRDGDQRGNVARPDGGEVPEVHRRDGDDP